MTSITIYSKTDCKFCTMAKTLLASFNKDYTEILLDRDIDRDTLISKFPTAKTFPIIVVDGEWIGGYDQLKVKIQDI